MEIAYPRSHTLQAQIEEANPKAPTCAELHAGKLINPFLTEEDPNFKGKRRIDVLLNRWYDHKIKNPETINLLEITKSTKEVGEEADARGAIRDLFESLDEKPVEILEVGEGI